MDSPEHGLEVFAPALYHIVTEPFFHSSGRGFCSELTTVPGVVEVHVLD